MQLQRGDLLIKPEAIALFANDRLGYDTDYLQEAALDGGSALFLQRFASPRTQNILVRKSETLTMSRGYREAVTEGTKLYLSAMNYYHNLIIRSHRQGKISKYLAQYLCSMQLSLVWAIRAAKSASEEMLRFLLKPYGKIAIGQVLLKRGPSNKKARRAVSRSRIIALLNDEYLGQYVATAKDINRRYEEMHNVFGAEVMRWAIDVYNENINTLNQIRTQYRNEGIPDYPGDLGVSYKHKALLRKQQKAAKKALVKSVKMLERVADKETVSKCLSRSPVEIPINEEFYLTQRVRRMFDYGWAGIDTKVYHREHGHVTNLCVYLDKTYPPEQLLGLILHQKAGIIHKYIEAANVNSLTSPSLWGKLCKELGIKDTVKRFDQGTPGTPILLNYPGARNILSDKQLERHHKALRQWERLARQVTEVAEKTINSLMPLNLRKVNLAVRRGPGLVPMWDQGTQ